MSTVNRSLRAAWAALLAAGLVSGCGGGRRIAAAGPACGTLRAGRSGRAVIVEVGLTNVPASTDLVTLGLKLGDGTAVFARTVRTQEGFSPELAAAPSITFSFDGAATEPPGRGEPQVWLQVTFELADGGRSADDSTFSLVLGDPETIDGCRMGITTSIFTRDGSPSLSGCIVRDYEEVGVFPLPPPQAARPPAVSFRFAERASVGPRALPIEIVPEIASADEWNLPPLGPGPANGPGRQVR